MRWVKLRVVFDKHLSIRRLPKEDREEIYAALRRYAETGLGGDVAYRAPGSLEVDFVRGGGQDVWFQVDRRDPDDPAFQPTMVVYSAEPSEIQEETEPD